MNLFDLFNQGNLLSVPSYQRAYAWEETQLNQFIQDLNEILRKTYYYGHFILEEREGVYEVIDGQQRLTTFMLFLLVCQSRGYDGQKELLNKFQTCDYDQKAFEQIKAEVLNDRFNWKEEKLTEEETQTSSIRRIKFALRHFYKAFDKKETQTRLSEDKIEEYIKTLLGAHISTHITKDKAVAVQIFELQNSRGIRLDLIEKVKAKLMKAVYLNPGSSEANIQRIQKAFAQVYHLEELSARNSFRGEMSLDEILLHHLRVIDDGKKLVIENPDFHSPNLHDTRENVVLNYIEDKLKSNASEYAVALAESFLASVQLFAKELPAYDESNPLIGDCLILERGLSMELFMILSHTENSNVFSNEAIISIWERFVFIRDFHDKFYQKKWRDDFARLFREVKASKSQAEIQSVLQKYLKEGFRPEFMDERSLLQTVRNYFTKNESEFQSRAFHWWQEKNVYLLYKYELENKANRNQLRNIFKSGRSIEHILPQSWDWSWIKESEGSVSEAGHAFNKEVNTWINGLGNLILVTASENSSLSNSHPADKRYSSCTGGSYSVHNLQSDKWSNPEAWKLIVKERGERIYIFLLDWILKS